MTGARLFIALLMLFSLTAKAQWGEGEEESEEKPKFKDRLFAGGGLGLGFSNYSDYFSISPLVGYKISSKLATGIGFQYRNTRYKAVSPPFTTNDFGASPFIRYYVFPPMFLHGEYEYLNYQFRDANAVKVRRSYGSFMAGAGLFQPLGQRAGVFIMMLYNFSYQNPISQYDYSPYQSPWILRAGITAGF